MLVLYTFCVINIYYIKSSREEWRSHFFFNGIEARCMHILNRCILLSFCAILNSPLDSVLLDEDTLFFKRFVHEFQRTCKVKLFFGNQCR